MAMVVAWVPGCQNVGHLLHKGHGLQVRLDRCLWLVTATHCAHKAFTFMQYCCTDWERLCSHILPDKDS